MKGASLVVAALMGTALTSCSKPPTIAPWSWTLNRAALPEASLSVHITGTGAAPAHYIVAGQGGELMTIVNYSYVFSHPQEGLVVIDPGYPKVSGVDLAIYPGKAASKRMNLKIERPLANQLEDAGIQTEQVKHLVVTHMHTDHAGGIGDFPKASLWLPEVEWRFGKKKRLLGGTDPSPYVNHKDIRFVRFANAYGPFEGHQDLFGDGSLILLPTPGHTPGHTSVLVNLRETSLLITGDVAWVDANWQGPTPKGWLIQTLLEFDKVDTMDSLQRIHDWSKVHPELLIIAGHEPANRGRLKLAPEVYR